MQMRNRCLSGNSSLYQNNYRRPLHHRITYVYMPKYTDMTVWIVTLIFVFELSKACKIFDLHSEMSASPTIFAQLEPTNSISLNVSFLNITEELGNIELTGRTKPYKQVRNITGQISTVFTRISKRESYVIWIPVLDILTELKVTCTSSCCTICTPIRLHLLGLRHDTGNMFLVSYDINTTAYPMFKNIHYKEKGSRDNRNYKLDKAYTKNNTIRIEMENLKHGGEYTLDMYYFDNYNDYCEYTSTIDFRVPHNPQTIGYSLEILPERISATNSSSNFFTTNYTFALVITVLLACVIVTIMLSISKCKLWFKMMRRPIENGVEISKYPSVEYSKGSNSSGKQEINVLYISADTQEKSTIDPYEFSPEKIENKVVIGEGAFGKVFYSKAHGLGGRPGYVVVAVKQLRENSPKDEVVDFLAEIEMLKTIGSHKNIVKLLAYVTKQEPYMILMELIMTGDLLEYLLQIRKMWTRHKDRGAFFTQTSDGSYIQPGDETDIQIPVIPKAFASSKYLPSEVLESSSLKTSSSQHSDEIIRANSNEKTPLIKDVDCPPIPALDHEELESFALQIANGMAHLEKIGIVHRDLAARNILITGRKTLKISDFGMSRNGPYVNSKFRKIPLRWWALEAIEHWKTDSRTDVWSYGVVLWEIGTLGAFPYEELPNSFVLTYLQSGKRLSKPEMCTDEHYGLMLKCWTADPTMRPTFKELVESLGVNKHNAYVDFGKISPNYVFPPARWH